MTSRVHTQGGANTFKCRVHGALPGALSRGHGRPHSAHPEQQGSPQNLALILGEGGGPPWGSGCRQGQGHKTRLRSRSGCHSYPPLQMGAWGRRDYITWPRQVLFPHLVRCPPGAEAGRRSAGPGLSSSPRLFQGQGCRAAGLQGGGSRPELWPPPNTSRVSKGPVLAETEPLP